MSIRLLRIIVLGFVAGVQIQVAAHAGMFSFTPLGSLPAGGFASRADGISDNGLVVVGSTGIGAYRWTSSGGMVALGLLSSGAFEYSSSSAAAISGDGTVIGGESSKLLTAQEATLWTADGGILGLGDLTGGVFQSGVAAISADGSVVVGTGYTVNGISGFRWTADGGMVALGGFQSRATSVSADGSVVVGSNNLLKAFRWTESEGMMALGDLPGGSFDSVAYGVSADGSVIVGISQSEFGFEAFRWTATGGMVGLGDLQGGSYSSRARDVSADGLVVVGQGSRTTGEEAFVWTEMDGMHSLRDVLVSHGVTGLSGWRLRDANAVSADGRIVVGDGINPNGKLEAWIAQIPEPSTFIMSALSLPTLLILAHRIRTAIRTR